MLDPRVEGKAHHLCHVVSENEGIVLCDKSRSDIFLTTRSVAHYWKEHSDKIHDENPWFLHNELKIWIRENKKATREDILRIILHQEMEGTKADLRKIRVE